MMTIPQLKAARALLGWTQQDLAKAAGLHLNVINNIERGTANPRQQTVARLQTALEGQGVVFLGDRGVDIKREAVTITRHTGDGFLRAFTNDILAALKEGDEVLSILADMRNFQTHDPDASTAFYAEKDRRGFRERLITRDMPGFYPRHSEHYRVVAPDLLGPVDTVIFGNHVAHIFWDAGEVMILANADLAATKRTIFEHYWQLGHEPMRAVRAAND